VAGYHLISADSHVNEPPDLWPSRVPEYYRDRVPRIERFEQGDAWIIEGAQCVAGHDDLATEVNG
jgi:hypothetical protein